MSGWKFYMYVRLRIGLSLVHFKSVSNRVLYFDIRLIHTFSVNSFISFKHVSANRKNSESRVRRVEIRAFPGAENKRETISNQ